MALYTYGYRNVYELQPLIDLGATKLEWEGTYVAGREGQLARR